MADSDLCTTSQWMQFFRNAGLPPNVAGNYALIFSDNRIQQNMLMDLSKEYLYDMGIKVMGDVIAILRYAKEFHTQLAKEKIMGTDSVLLPSAKRSSPASRIVGHYTRASTTTPVKIIPQKRILNLNKGSTVCEESAMKKARRVLPEEEGAYKIKMPTGKTERSRKILEQQSLMASKKSVFDRLGDSDVSSSTDIKRSIGSSSVFNRLGPSTSEVSTSTTDQTRNAPLAYQGVLKQIKPEKKVIVSLKQDSNVGKRSNVAAHKLPVVKRLGTKPVTLPKRTVLNNPGSHGVMQINSILQQNAQINDRSRRPLNTTRTVSGSLPATSSRSSITSRLGVKKHILSISSGSQGLRSNTIVLANNSSRPFRLQQKSVFQRLGK